MATLSYCRSILSLKVSNNAGLTVFTHAPIAISMFVSEGISHSAICMSFAVCQSSGNLEIIPQTIFSSKKKLLCFFQWYFWNKCIKGHLYVVFGHVKSPLCVSYSISFSHVQAIAIFRSGNRITRAPPVCSATRLYKLTIAVVSEKLLR